MTEKTEERFLRIVVGVDAATAAGAGAMMALGAGIIAEVTRIPAGLLLVAGLALLPIAAFMAAVAARPVVPQGPVRLIVAGNVLWVAASLWLAIGGPIAPNGLGIAFILAQAAVVAALTWLEARGLAALQPAAAARPAAPPA